jgi:threonine dehydrogenase-like Zn-dependent dehydrogenase
MTEGRGADVCVEAVGFEPDRGFFDKGIVLKGGQAPAHKYIDDLLKYVVEGKVKLDDIITHRIPLSEVARGYKIFKEKEEDCVKVVMDPWI